jgi:2-succinyl-5-enolpyruvyl-6-hydroxy-3-cyclohexene-1-carboxylate synthase
MSAPNRNALWGATVAAELAAAGVEAAAVAPGSRSTPLTVALAEREDIRVFSHLDERSAAYFALGRGRRTGRPTPVVTTSGTATANLHPAVMEADQARVPLVALTADRPPELRDSGANQTADQEGLYGDAVRWYHDLAEPEATPRKLRYLRTAVARAVARAAGASDPAGPVHLNVPFRKPLEPTPVEGDVPEDLPRRAVEGRDGPYVSVRPGRTDPAPADAAAMAAAADADRGLVVAGPDTGAPAAVAELGATTGYPVLADPLSGVRYGSHVPQTPVCGAYDDYLDERVTRTWPDPEVVFRFGDSPTSKPLRTYLARTGARRFLVAPAAGWREATYTATDLVVADPGRAAAAVVERDPDGGSDAWRGRFERAETARREVAAESELPAEGAVLRAVARDAPDPATLFVSNSMPVRDLDRFGVPRSADLTALGNRGVSGIDGITSTALGAGSATDDPLVVVAGDLAFHHDTNGLLAVERCGVDATVVLINNDGGGIFHMLPVEDHPTFESQFKTPHGLDFAPVVEHHGVEFLRTSVGEFSGAYAASLSSPGTQVVEVRTDAAASHRARERLHERVVERLEN